MSEPTLPVSPHFWSRMTERIKAVIDAPLTPAECTPHRLACMDVLEDIYKALTLSPTPQRTIKFQAKVDQTTRLPHHVWLGAVRSDGRPIVRWQGKIVSAAKIWWELCHGAPLPDGTIIRRRCSEPRCIAPEHHHIHAPKTGTPQLLDTPHPVAYRYCRNGHMVDARIPGPCSACARDRASRFRARSNEDSTDHTQLIRQLIHDFEDTLVTADR